MDIKKITIVTGHYGSGKTNFAVNLAMSLREQGKGCTIVDLDIVNPYFRTADFHKMFEERGIKLAVSKYANSNLDIPSLTVSFEQSLMSDDYLIIDVGGDDAGAFALGRFRPQLSCFADNMDVLYVINKYRYLLREPIEALNMLGDIETASGMKCTGIVNNSNLGIETDIDTVKNSLEYADEVAQLCDLPIKTTCVQREYADKLAVENVFPVDIYVKTQWNK